MGRARHGIALEADAVAKNERVALYSASTVLLLLTRAREAAWWSTGKGGGSVHRRIEEDLPVMVVGEGDDAIQASDESSYTGWEIGRGEVVVFPHFPFTFSYTGRSAVDLFGAIPLGNSARILSWKFEVPPSEERKT